MGWNPVYGVQWNALLRQKGGHFEKSLILVLISRLSILNSSIDVFDKKQKCCQL
jgi:hypothetical protein